MQKKNANPKKKCQKMPKKANHKKNAKQMQKNKSQKENAKKMRKKCEKNAEKMRKKMRQKAQKKRKNRKKKGLTTEPPGGTSKNCSTPVSKATFVPEQNLSLKNLSLTSSGKICPLAKLVL